MKHSNAELLSSSRIVPPDVLLKFGYSPYGGVQLDSSAAALSLSYGGTPRVDITESGMNLRNGEGLVVGHSAQLTVVQKSEMQVLGSGAADSQSLISRSSASGSAGSMIFHKSRGASIGSQAIVQNGDGLGQITWHGDDGVDNASQAAAISVLVDGAPGVGDMPARLAFYTTADGAESPTERMRIDSVGGAFINESSNANMTVGLTINQGANDDEILAFKSSDVSHGYTSVAETDTYFKVLKKTALYGGAEIRVVGEDSASIGNTLQFTAYGGTANTAKTTSGYGLVNVFVAEHDGANSIANITADGNVFSIVAQVGGSALTRFLIDEDGDMYSATAGQTFDNYDDMALIETYDMARSGSLKGQIKAGFGRAMLMDESTLIEAGVLGDTIANGGLTNQTQLSRVLTGGVRQLNHKHLSLVERVDSLMLELEATTKQLAALSASESN